MPQRKWHVIPSCQIIHLESGVALFNSGKHDAHVEVSVSGELTVKQLRSGQLIIQSAEES